MPELIDNSLEMMLVTTGLLNLGIAMFAAISTSRCHAVGRLKIRKYALIAAYVLYAILESNWLTQGLYHASSWMPIAWNLLDLLWMIIAMGMMNEGTRRMSEAAYKLMQLSHKLEGVIENAHQ